MKDQEMLTEDLVGLLDAERDIDEVETPARDRMRARLEAALPLAPLGLPGHETAPRDAPTPSGDLGGRALDVVRGKLWGPALALLVGAAGGAAGHAAWQRRSSSAEHVVAVEASVRQPMVMTIVLPPRRTEENAGATIIDLTGAASAASSPSSVAAAPSASAGERPRSGAQLNAELLLLDAARTALTRGDYESALAALRRDARENPHGQLAEEREVMMVQALSLSGDAAGAKKRAADFKQQFPDSLSRDTVDQSTPKPSP